jgi:16S rRNA U516 pseudouridylate synthase RsuA-like enzyme
VRELERTEYAGLKCGDLKKGDWRKLSVDEVKLLYKHSGLEQAK